MEQIGRYQISGELGRGAMGVIYAATDPLIGRPVAIKTIRLSSLDSGDNREELTRRLYREAQSAGILSHPGIITIHDVGEKGDDAYIVMEFVEGKSLEDLLVSSAPQDPDKYVSILRQTAVALDYAHSKGIVHRDIKPSNIMICEDGRVKVADFGVAKLTASASMTQSGLVLGTPSYMSPEQAQGRSIDGRSDQFSLAVVAYRILTGSLPFVASTLTALLAKILWEEPDYHSAGLRPPLLAVFKKALAKDPQLRFVNCVGFVQELEAAVAQDRSQSLQGKPETAPASEPGQPDVVPPKRTKSALIAWASAGAIALIALAFFAIKVLQKPGTPVPSLTPAESDRKTETPAPAVVPANIAKGEGKPTEANPPIQSAVPEVKETKKAVKPEPVKPDSAILPSPKISTATPKTMTETKVPSPVSGTLVWSGELQKNSVLVIEERQVSIGSLSGELPGKPVQIEVVPKDIIVRQSPNETNAWKLIILYSGNQKYSSITIHWKLSR